MYCRYDDPYSLSLRDVSPSPRYRLLADGAHERLVFLPVLHKACESEDGVRLLVGEGSTEARENRLVVRPADPATDLLVLRYNWREGLVCKTPGATIEPYQADKNVTFLAVRPNGAPEVEIGYRAAFRPLAPNFDGKYHH